MKLSYVVEKSDESIKQILKNKFYMSERFISKLKKNHGIFINDTAVFINYKISSGDILCIVENSLEDSSGIVPNKNIVLDILYEDEFFLIVNKPARIAVHPSILHYQDSLSNRCKVLFSKNWITEKNQTCESLR